MSKSMSMKKEANIAKSNRTILYALVAATAIAISIGIYFSSQKPSVKSGSGSESTPAARQLGESGALVSTAPVFEFGKISMRAGNVSHLYWIKNAGATPLTITNISTSCMCTVATLITQSGRKKGPFGMPGHGPALAIDERLAPGQVAQVEVVFDPAAHGPAGIGKTDRLVTIRNSAGRSLALAFSAYVTP